MLYYVPLVLSRASYPFLSPYEAGSEYGLVEPQRERTYRLYVPSYSVLEVALPAIRNCVFHSRAAVSVPLAGICGPCHLLPWGIRVVFV